MDFHDLISDFSARYGVSDLVAEDNAAALDIDGIPITLVASDDTLSISAGIGEPPADGRAEFAELLLEASLQSEAFFAKEPEHGDYIMVRRLPLRLIDARLFDEALESLVNLAETWRRILSDFRPVAKAAAEQAGEVPEFGAHGFVQV